MDDGDDIFNSSSAEESFKHDSLIATLAKKFNSTSFKVFQKTIIKDAIDRQDTLVVQPTGSWKSLCFQSRHCLKPILLTQPTHTRYKCRTISDVQFCLRF